MQEEREWLIEAERLVEAFRETRNLFLTSRVSGFGWLDVFSVIIVSRCRICLSEACFQGVNRLGNSKQKQSESQSKNEWHRGYISTLVRIHRIQRRGMANTLM